MRAFVVPLLLLSLGALSPAASQSVDLVDHAHLRVCADPANLPFSNEKQEGFENRIANLVAKDLGVPVEYTWFPQTTGFVRQTLNAGRCDLIIGFPQGDELVQNTNHYYSSAYVLIVKTGGALDGVLDLSDPRLKDKAVGIVAGTPPADLIAANGLMAKARPYQLVVDRRYDSPAEKMITDLASGEIDAGILWGPIGGYFAKQSVVPLTVSPLVNEKSGPRMAYRITMGLRKNEQEWKRQLNDILQKEQPEINKILLGYGVPILDD